jgi:mannose-6-phosphate isomerase-like protein (cupin superfamily)
MEWEGRFEYHKQNIFSAGDIGIVGSRFQIIKFENDAYVKSHYHRTTTEIFHVLGGNGIFKINGKEIPATPHIVVLIEPLDYHEIIAYKGLEIAISKWDESVDDIVWKEFNENLL